MATLKQRSSELAIHGGGPPAFGQKIPLFAPHVGNSDKFARLAEKMFLQSEASLAGDFEREYAAWVGVSVAVAFSSLSAAIHGAFECLQTGFSAHVLHGASLPFPAGSDVRFFDGALGACERDEDRVDVRVDAFGFDCASWAEDEGDWIALGRQSAGCGAPGARFGSSGRLTITQLGREQLLHGLDAAVVTTDDDLLAHRILRWRDQQPHDLNPTMSEAAAAMALANLDCVDRFIDDNRTRFECYRKCLEGVRGVSLLHSTCRNHWNHQAIILQVDQGRYGKTRDSLFHHLAAENIGVGKPFEAEGSLDDFPLAQATRNRLLQLPNGPGLDADSIAAICRVIELSQTSGLESPDPLRLAA